MNAKLIAIISILLFGLSVRAQTSQEFITEIERISVVGYPKNDVSSLYKKYNHILFFFNSNSQLGTTIKGVPLSDFPLQEFKQSTWYKQNIHLLLLDTAYHKRSLGCFLAAAANDTDKVAKIESMLVRSDYKEFWHANILMVLQTKHLDPLVKTIIQYQNDQSSAHLMEAFLKLDIQVLEKFGLDSILSSNTLVKYLAIRSLATGKASEHKDRLLRQVVQTGPVELRGWAISVLSHFKSPDMHHLLAPYLNDPDLRRVALLAIANSTSKKDQAYVSGYGIVDLIDADVLNAFIGSSEETSVRQALRFVKERALPEEYVLFVDHTPMLNDDRYFDQVCETLTKSISQSKIYPLYGYFSNKKDEKTIRFLLERLSSEKVDNMSRSAIVSKLMGIKSPIIESRIPSLMQHATVDDAILIQLLIQYNNHQYDDVLKSWMETGLMERFYYDKCMSYIDK